LGKSKKIKIGDLVQVVGASDSTLSGKMGVVTNVSVSLNPSWVSHDESVYEVLIEGMRHTIHSSARNIRLEVL